jgi:hypothetical protein
MAPFITSLVPAATDQMKAAGSHEAWPADNEERHAEMRSRLGEAPPIGGGDLVHPPGRHVLVGEITLEEQHRRIAADAALGSEVGDAFCPVLQRNPDAVRPGEALAARDGVGRRPVALPRGDDGNGLRRRLSRLSHPAEADRHRRHSGNDVPHAAGVKHRAVLRRSPCCTADAAVVR